MNACESRLRKRIRAEGPLPFDAFMSEALYGEGGYYLQDPSPVGRSGDFVTGSSYSPLFARTTRNLLGALDRALQEQCAILEVGYGNGRHLENLASTSPGRGIYGIDLASRPLDEPIRVIEHLDGIDEGSIRGLIFSYELFDALPVRRWIGKEDGLPKELRVGLGQGSQFEWIEEQGEPKHLETWRDTPLAPGQIVDVAPGWAPLYEQLATKLDRGLVVTFDYGFQRERLFDPRVRMHGTLACYRRHHVHRDVFRDVGEQDLTAHVDFTTLIHSGEASGLQTECFTRQALWLAANGLFEGLGEASIEERSEARVLLDGEGMGEDIRVLVQSRGIDTSELWNRQIC